MNTVRVFAEGVAEQIRKYLPEDLEIREIRVVENRKNNGVLLTGLNVEFPGTNMSPVIYMNDYYDEVRQGAAIEETMERIAGCIGECRYDAMMRLNIGLEDMDALKQRVVPMLVNAKANRDMLQTMPYMQVEDLAMIFKVDVSVPGKESFGTMKVKNEMLMQWGISKEELYQRAISNLQKYASPVLTPMGEMIPELASGHKTEINLLKDPQRYHEYEGEMMFVLTNEDRYHGAAALLSTDVMDKIHEMMPEGFYILPSSIHETLIVSKACGMNGRDLGKMVREVNRDMVSREEILSDRVYEYDKGMGRITQVPESVPKSREASR